MKRPVLAGLIVLNVVLVVALLGRVYHTPAAQAQGVGLSGNYLTAAGEVKGARDGLFLIDLENRYMHLLLFERSSGRIVYVDGRSLVRDLAATSTPEVRQGVRQR